MEKAKFFELFDYMLTGERAAFIDDFTGWNENAEIPGFSLFSSCEGNGIKSLSTGKDFEPQYQSVRRGNHLKVKCRKGDTSEEILLGDLVPEGVTIVVVTGSERLLTLSPIFEKRSEMMDWLHLVGEYVSKNGKDIIPLYWENDMIRLAKFLFENQENKILDESKYDKYAL